MKFKEVFEKIFNAPQAQESQVDAEQLRMGIEIESEHSTYEAAAKAIALAHLGEDPLYYTKLKKMEQEAKS